VRIKGSATSEKEEEEEDMAGIHIYRVSKRERERAN